MNRLTNFSRGRFGKIFSSLLWFLAISTLIYLLFSFALPQDLSRTTPVYSRLVVVAFFGQVLIFHLSLLLAAIAALALPLRRWRLAMLCFITAIATCLFSLHPRVPGHTPFIVGSKLRIMSMNLKYTHSNPELIFGQVASIHPDVLVLQDYTPFAQSALERGMGSDYRYRVFRPYGLEGLAIYSRRRFVGGVPQIIFTGIRRQIRVEVELDGKPIVIYVEHPFSPRTRKRIINNRLAMHDLAQEIQAEEYPVIVAGDFNFTADTPNADALGGCGLHDAFDQAGHGRGSTWPVSPRWLQWLPGFRIDHIYVSHQLACTTFSVGQYDGSDHLPIVADVGIWRTR